MELVELQWRFKEAEVEHVGEVSQLAVLVRDVSNVLVDLGMPPFPRIPGDPCATGDILEAVGTISVATVPETRCRMFPITASFSHHAHGFTHLFSFLFICEYSRISGLPPQSIASQGFKSGVESRYV
jgi:hypothetical protein